MRRCVGCGERAPRARLRRLVAADGVLVADPLARLPGRGAWLHPERACAERAVSRRAFTRALRSPVTIPDDLVDLVVTWPRSASTN